MTRPGTAGHDPVFPLHHGNVDRHYALWQALWPDSWWLPMEMAASQNSYTTMIGTIETPRTPLIPFRKPPSSASPTPNNAATFWNSNDLRNHDALGYQYDPIPSTLSKEDRKKAATYEINLKYAWFNSQPDVQNSALLDPVPMDKVEAFTEFPPFVDGKTVQVNLFQPDTPPENFLFRVPATEETFTDERRSVPLSVEEEQDVKPPVQQPLNFDITPDRKIQTWTAHIRALRHCLSTSFTIFIFLGDFPPNPAEWATAPTLVSALHQFINHDANAFVPSAPTRPESASDEESNYPGLANSPNGRLHLREQSEPQPRQHSSCANCALQSNASMQISDFAPLTTALASYISYPGSIPPIPNSELDDAEEQEDGIDLQSLNEGDVVPFLKRNLHWRVVRVSLVLFPLKKDWGGVGMGRGGEESMRRREGRRDKDEGGEGGII